jgi:hypothetical protein
MAIFYSDNAERSAGGPSVPYSRWNAVEGYLTHYENYLMLDFLAKANTTQSERAQARKELGTREAAWSGGSSARPARGFFVLSVGTSSRKSSSRS